MELRKRLIIIVVAVVIGRGFTWNPADKILIFMEKPLTGTTYLDTANQKGCLYLKEHYPAVYSRTKRIYLRHKWK